MYEQEELIYRIEHVRTGIKLCGWIVATLSEGHNEPEEESEKCDLQEGIVYYLELLAGEMEKMQEEVKNE